MKILFPILFIANKLHEINEYLLYNLLFKLLEVSKEFCELLHRTSSLSFSVYLCVCVCVCVGTCFSRIKRGTLPCTRPSKDQSSPPIARSMKAVRLVN